MIAIAAEIWNLNQKASSFTKLKIILIALMYVVLLFCFYLRHKLKLAFKVP